jgi:hypothetical protein
VQEDMMRVERGEEKEEKAGSSLKVSFFLFFEARKTLWEVKAMIFRA